LAELLAVVGAEGLGRADEDEGAVAEAADAGEEEDVATRGESIAR